MSLTAVGSLSYLHACVQEAIRLVYGASVFVKQLVSDESMILRSTSKQQRTWIIPDAWRFQ
jgi:hypothetical protein